MSVQFLIFYGILSISVHPARAFLQSDGDPPGPAFAFSWSDDMSTFIPGDTAVIRVKVLGNFDPHSQFVPTISVNGKPGNSTFISGLAFDLPSWSISFVPILVGVFNVLLTEDHFGIFDSSLSFFVQPGPMNPAMSVASWMDSVNEFVAGTKGMALILPKDAFGNQIPSTNAELTSYVFNASASFHNGSAVSILSVVSTGWSPYGYLRIEFIAATAGFLLLHINAGADQTFQGSPLPFRVQPGAVEVPKCFANWKHGSNVLQLHSLAEVYIHQLDVFGNLVPGVYPFDAEVLEDTKLSIPVPDMRFKEHSYGVQLLTFTALEPGNYLLLVYDGKNNQSIANVPYNFTVFVGYCDETHSIINGSGLNSSIAGQEASFSVYLYDKYQYHSPLDMQRLQVEINQKNSSYSVTPRISPIETSMGSGIPWKTLESVGHDTVAPQPSSGLGNASAESSTVFTFAYNVLYSPEKEGVYDIHVLCGNIMVSGEHPLKKEVRAGEVNISMSSVVRYAPKVEKMVKNDVVISLVDTFSNPVLSQDTRLKLEIGSINHSAFSTWNFQDNKDGSYTGYYLVEEVGTYEMCASIDGNRFLPCPFGVNAYSGAYFPKARDDSVSVWEDESVAFSVLGNDFFAGDNTTIVEFSNPGHGSILRNGPNFRYTPHKEFYGNDTFMYTINDVNGNVAAASVKISVLSIPPQFLSFPAQLNATEDLIGPRFGGFHGFEITHPDPQENISVTLNASFGSVSLYPMLVNFWKPVWNGFCVSTGDGQTKGLMIIGHLEVINTVLNSIQYIGNENFFGEDVISMSISNGNGANNVNITMSVDPVNDPPYIRAPEHIVLEYNGAGKGSRIYKENDNFEFRIGDPDFSNFPGKFKNVV